MKKDELRYLQRLAEIYPTIGKASTEIINLQSILARTGEGRMAYGDKVT